MTDAAPVPAAAPTDIAQMTKVQKLAALFIIIGADSAAQMMQQLEPEQLEAVAGEMARLPMLPQDLQRAILKEFSGVAVEASSALSGGVGFAQAVLERSVGSFRASGILSRLSTARPTVTAMQQIVEMETHSIYNLIRHERPQTIALIMSYLGPQKSAQLLNLLKPDMRESVIERLATLAPTPIEVIEQLVEVLNRRAGVKPSRALNQTGGLKMTAELLNALDKNASKTLLAAIEERNAELGTGIRQKMFVFEDLVLLDQSALQKVLREVDMRDLAVALKSSSEKLKSALLACISKRAAETVNEEMGFMGALKAKEVEAAQTRIIEVVRRLESEGEIELGGKPNEAAA